MTDEEKARFKALRSEFTTAALALLEAWKDGGEFTKDYPFTESFGDLVHGIIEWDHADDDEPLPSDKS
jgi:hypothetical protein